MSVWGYRTVPQVSAGAVGVGTASSFWTACAQALAQIASCGWKMQKTATASEQSSATIMSCICKPPSPHWGSVNYTLWKISQQTRRWETAACCHPALVGLPQCRTVGENISCPQARLGCLLQPFLLREEADSASCLADPSSRAKGAAQGTRQEAGAGKTGDTTEHPQASG